MLFQDTPTAVLPNIPDNLGTAIVAAGALGTAAFGIVEGLKSTAMIGEAGFSRAMGLLGPLGGALRLAYGPDYLTVLRARYRGDRAEFRRSLRQGIRVGLNQDNAAALANFIGTVPGDQLAAAVRQLALATPDKPGSDRDRSVVGRFELAVDARVDAALTVAQTVYAAAARNLAMILAIGIGLGVAALLGVSLLAGLIVGLVAVPIAPIAKDIASAISAASRALRVGR